LQAPDRGIGAGAAGLRPDRRANSAAAAMPPAADGGGVAAGDGPGPTAGAVASVAVQTIGALRAQHRVDGRAGAVAVGLSLEAGTCEVNHVVCGEFGWYKGPGAAPPMARGDVITSVDGQIVLPSDVAQKLRAGPLGSKVLVKGLRGSSRNAIEATLVRQDAGIVDALVHVEDALAGVRGAAAALGGRPAGMLEARVAALGRQVVKLSSACAKQETTLSERSAVYQDHIKGLEDAMLRLAQGDPSFDEAGRAAVDGLRERDSLRQRIEQLESELAGQAQLSQQLADVRQQLHEAEEREMSRAVLESKEREAAGRSAGGSGSMSDALAAAELDAKVRQLNTALSLAKTDLAAARVERDKALGDAEKTKTSANDMLRALQKEVSDEKGARELLNTKMMVAKKEAEEMRAAREADKKRVQQLEKETGALRASAASLQKQLDEETKKFDAERAQIREKANALIKDKDGALAKVRTELQDISAQMGLAQKKLAGKEKEAVDLATQLKALQDRLSAEVTALQDKVRTAEDKMRAAEDAGAAAAEGRSSAELDCDRMRQQVADVHARLEELERLVLRGHEQTGTLVVFPLSLADINARARVHTRARAHTHTFALAHTHTHTHSLSLSLSLSLALSLPLSLPLSLALSLSLARSLSLSLTVSLSLCLSL